MITLNLYVQPEWTVDELRDFVDVVCWMIHTALKYDPAIGIVVGGDLNKNGMKELPERLAKYGLQAVFGKSTQTHEKGSHLDDIFTNLKIVSKQICTMKGVSDHHMLLCELKVNPEGRPLPTLANKMLKP